MHADNDPVFFSPQPFPLNPTFNPPAPLSDSVRAAIFNAHIKDPAKNNLRHLSTTYNVAIDRIRAILKLKALEQEFVRTVRAISSHHLHQRPPSPSQYDEKKFD